MVQAMIQISKEANQVLNIVKNKIQLGKWQRIFTIELDRSRDRQIAIQIIGT